MIDGCSFDFIMSLGGSCATAKQLSFCGLRQRSLPFDWLFHLNNQTLDYLIEGFSNGFDHWMFINDMRPLEEGERGNSNCFQYHDNATGYNTIHDFHNEIHNLSEYDSVKQKYKRRFDRLEHYLSKAHTALFVLDARYDVDILKLKKIKNVVESKHPDLVLSILLMQFISVKEDMYDVYTPKAGTTISWTGGITGAQTVTTKHYEKDFVMWGLIKYGTTQDFIDKVYKDGGKIDSTTTATADMNRGMK